uniref:Uncharacterized protein n=1 Tax=Arundo donax TaxID=35708 RepID=A0A0A8XZT7_ARUDO
MKATDAVHQGRRQRLVRAMEMEAMVAAPQ